jgi:Integrase core domain
MAKGISKQVKLDLLEALRWRYHQSSKKHKGRILDEFVAVSGYHRKHAVRLLVSQGRPKETGQTRSRRIYDEAVKEAMIVAWEAADRICGKRLKAILPDLIDAMERHGHLELDPVVRTRLLAASAATIGRLLAPIRSHAVGRRKRRKRPKMSKKVPTRTFADWDKPTPGLFEIDFVVHCGGSMAGSFIHTLVATDVCTGWIECIPLLARERSLVVESLKVLFIQIPFPAKGIDSDNDSAFINDIVFDFCNARGLEFTRSRPHHKHDQA